MLTQHEISDKSYPPRNKLDLKLTDYPDYHTEHNLVSTSCSIQSRNKNLILFWNCNHYSNTANLSIKPSKTNRGLSKPGIKGRTLKIKASNS